MTEHSLSEVDWQLWEPPTPTAEEALGPVELDEDAADRFNDDNLEYQDGFFDSIGPEMPLDPLEEEILLGLEADVRSNHSDLVAVNAQRQRLMTKKSGILRSLGTGIFTEDC